MFKGYKLRGHVSMVNCNLLIGIRDDVNSWLDNTQVQVVLHAKKILGHDIILVLSKPMLQLLQVLRYSRQF